MGQPALAAYRGRELAPGEDVRTDEDLTTWLRSAHDHLPPGGDLQDGRRRMAVVDARLRIHGIEGLRVADASVMPVVTGENTNAPAIMIEEKAAEFLRGE